MIKLVYSGIKFNRMTNSKMRVQNLIFIMAIFKPFTIFHWIFMKTR